MGLSERPFNPLAERMLLCQIRLDNSELFSVTLSYKEFKIFFLISIITFFLDVFIKARNEMILVH